MLASLPDLAKLVREFHARGIKCLLPYNPWDTGTARPPNGMDDVTALVEAMASVDADGFNGDTMFGVNNSYYELSKEKSPLKPVAVQPECGADGSGRLYRDSSPHAANASGEIAPYSERGTTVAYNLLSWGYWGYFPPGVYNCANCTDTGGIINASVRMSVPIAGIGPPLVSRYRVLDARHMTQICERWAINRDDGLQHAYVNGAGYAPWESIWGIWNPLSERHGETLRRAMHVLKFFQGRSEHTVGGAVGGGPHSFEPLVSVGQFPGVFCSWLYSSQLLVCVDRRGDTLPADATDPTTPLPGAATTLTLPCPQQGHGYWDVWAGVKLKPDLGEDVACARVRSAAHGGGDATTAQCTYSVSLSDRFGGVAMLPANADTVGLTAPFIKLRREFAQTPLGGLSAETGPLQQTMVPPPPPLASSTVAATHAAAAAATNTTLISAAAFEFKVNGVQVEGAGGLAGPDKRSQPDVQFPWEGAPTREHPAHVVDVDAFRIDTYPVTNRRYDEFLQRTGWRPRSDHNWLMHWDTISGSEGGVAVRGEHRHRARRSSQSGGSHGPTRRRSVPLRGSASPIRGSGSSRRRDRTSALTLGATSGTMPVFRLASPPTQWASPRMSASPRVGRVRAACKILLGRSGR